MENCDHIIFFCFINSILYDPAYKASLFKKFVFTLEAYYSFKINSILVRKVIFLKKNGDVICKIYSLISWSTICTPLILVPASLKMAGISAITIGEWTTLANSSYKVKRIRLETIYFSFRLDIGIRNNNHVNAFVSVTKLKKGRINLRRNLWKIKLAKDTKSQSARKRFTIVQIYSSKIAI